MDPVSAGLLAVGVGAKIAGELSPAAFAQRREFKKARDRLAKGEYGFSQAQKQQDTTAMNQAVAQQAAGQQADIARQQAAGLVSGGGAAAAQREIAKAQAAQVAQNQAAVQAQSNEAAKAQYAADQGMVAQQAARNAELWGGIANTALTAGTKGALKGIESNVDTQAYKKKALTDMEIAQAVAGQGRVDVKQ